MLVLSKKKNSWILFLTRTSDRVVVMKFVVIFCIDVIFHAQKRTRANKGGRGGGQNSGILSEHTFWMPSFGYWPVLYFQSDSSQCNLWFFFFNFSNFYCFPWSCCCCYCCSSSCTTSATDLRERFYLQVFFILHALILVGVVVLPVLWVWENVFYP